MRAIAAFILLAVTYQIHAESPAYQQGREAAGRGDYDQAYTVFLKAAKQGDAWSQFGLGVLYLNGNGAPKDATLSSDWFQKAAAQNLSFAQFNLGNAYLHGRGVESDLTKAAFWWQQAAEQGNVNAQSNLGTLMYFDYATEQSKRLGMAWLITAANSGDKAARTQLIQIDNSNHSDSIWQSDPELSEVKILTMPYGQFSINLFTAKQPASVENFLHGYNLAGKVYIYRFLQDDSFLYGILYGRYPSKEAAKETINSMRPELRKHGPWSITIDTIKNKIHAIHTKQLEAGIDPQTATSHNHVSLEKSVEP